MTGRALLVLLTAVVSAGCATLNSGAYAVAGLNPARIRSYAWAPVEQGPTGDARLDANRFFDESVRRSMDRELARRGLELRTTGTPDVLVRYYFSAKQQALPRDRSDAGERSRRIDVLDVGSLVVDLTDTTDGRLLWRGWVEGAIDGVIDDQAWMEQRIDEAVRRLLQRLPQDGLRVTG